MTPASRGSVPPLSVPSPLSASDRELFHRYAGYWLVKLYVLLPDEHQPPLRRFLIRAWREGLYDPRWQRGIGRRVKVHGEWRSVAGVVRLLS